MGDAREILAQAWMRKARRDLSSAVRLASGEEPLLDTAIYHCHQAAEKSIKAFLVSRDRTPDKTHDLRRLGEIAAEYEPGFTFWASVLAELTPYATEFRYPDDVEEPSRDEYDRAYASARKFCAFVRTLLPNNE